MHDAFECVAILERLPLEIDCIASAGETLLVGTNKGHLLVYNIREDVAATQAANGEQKFDVELHRSNKAFGRKPIIQLVIVEAQGIIISLSDGIISVHDFETYALKQQFPSGKGVTFFSVDHASTLPTSKRPVRLCVVSKRKMQLFYWSKDEFVKLYEDTAHPETPRVAVWIGKFICFALKREYQLLAPKTGNLYL